MAITFVLTACNPSGGAGAPQAPLPSAPTAAPPAATAPTAPAVAGNPACEPDKVATKYPGLAGKTIKIGIDPTYPPLMSRDKADPNKLVGHEPAMADAAMKCIGLDYQFSTMGFAGLIPALQAGQTDIIWSSLFYSAERAKVVDFVIYLKVGQAGLVKNGNPKKIMSWDEMCGHRLSVTLGTVQETAGREQNSKCIAAGKVGVEITTYPTGDGPFRAIQNDRADVYVSDLVLIDQIINDNPGQFERAFAMMTDIVYGPSVKNGNDELLNALFEAVQVLQKNGTQKKILEANGMDSIQVVKAEIRKD